MGPQKSLSGIINEVRSQTDEVRSFVIRMRAASRRLTGSSGEQPTALASLQRDDSVTIKGEVPLMVDLTTAVEALNSATSDLRDEITYMENLAETAMPTDNIVVEFVDQTATKEWADY